MRALSLPFAAFLSLAALGSQVNDYSLNFVDICTKNGFATEKYEVVTPDDYILSLYRIPGTVQEMESGQGEQKPAVLFVHALDTNMLEWVINDPEQAPAFVLAREGYDVWLGNNRGSEPSQGHKTLSVSKKAYS